MEDVKKKRATWGPKDSSVTSVCKAINTVEKDRLVSKVKGFEGVPLFWITLYLSNKCTKRCPACYSLTQKDDDYEMKDNVFEDLLEFIPKVYDESNIRMFLLAFLGGEPLLRTDRIKRVLDRANRDKFRMIGCVFTNADLIDSVNWNDLEKVPIWNVNATNETVSEIERRLKIIESNAPYVQSESVIMTLDDNNISGNRVEEFVKMAMENEYRIRLYWNMFKGNNLEYKKKIIKKYHSALDIMEDYQNRGYDVSYNSVLGITLPRHWDKIEGLDTPYHCGKGILSVRPDGSIGACLRNHCKTVGTIWSDNPTKLIKVPELYWSYKRSDVPQECKECIARETCQAGCPNDRFVNYGTYSGKSPFCEVFKEIIPRMVELSEK